MVLSDREEGCGLQPNGLKINQPSIAAPAAMLGNVPIPNYPEGVASFSNILELSEYFNQNQTSVSQIYVCKTILCY